MGATTKANFNAYLVANIFGRISPKNNIKNVIDTEISKNHIAPLSAKFAKIVSQSVAAYIDKATFTKLFQINIAISVLSHFCLRCNSKDHFALAGNSFAYLLILYIGTHITANSEEENNAESNNNQITIRKGVIWKNYLKITPIS